MSNIRLFQMDPIDVPTPPTDAFFFFFDSTNSGEPSYKDDAGVVTTMVGTPGVGVPVGGSAGQVLEKINGTDYNTQWATPSSGFANPMTTAGDIITGGVAGAAGRLAVGTNGHVLTVVAGAPAWQAASGGAYTGTANRIDITGSVIDISATYVGQNTITTVGTVTVGTWTATVIGPTFGGTGQTTYATGDILYASATNVLSKLAAGTNTHVLTMTGGVPVWAAPGGGGGITGFTSTLETASPNNTVNASKLVASGGTTNQDFVIQPKGSGAIISALPDNAAAGGNKRGTNAVDLQTQRSGPTRVASGANSTISGGNSGIASAQYSTIGGGNANEASAIGATVAGGQSNRADGIDSYAIGNNANTRGITGATARAGGTFANAGEAQSQSYVLRNTTTNATQTTLTTDAAAAGGTNQVLLTANFMWAVVKGTVHGAQKTTGDAAAWEFTAFIQRYTSTTMVVACTPTLIGAAAGASTWALAIDADTTNHGLRIRVTGEAAKTIRWVADVYSCSQIGWT